MIKIRSIFSTCVISSRSKAKNPLRLDIADRQANQRWREQDPSNWSSFEAIWLGIYHQALCELQPEPSDEGSFLLCYNIYIMTPKFTAVAVMTIDGKIAKNSHHNVNWSSAEDKAFLRQQIAKHDAIIVGRNTFEVAKKALTKKEYATRNYIVLTRSAKTFKKQSRQVLYLNPQKIDLKKTIEKLGYKKVCILGGTQTYSLMLRKNLLDEIFLTVEPLVFGTGLTFFEGNLPAAKFKLISIKKLNHQGAILLHYQKI